MGHEVANWVQAIVGLPLLVAGVGAAALFLVRLERRWKLRDYAGSRSRGADPAVVDELKKLQNQMAELRETTTRYDVSFDAALQRIGERVGAVEVRLASADRERFVDARGAAIGER